MPRIEVEFYRKPNGREPAREFLDSLDKRTRSRVSDMIMILADNGDSLREPFSKYLGDGLFELRVQTGGVRPRILFFFFVGRKAILTNGFLKKTQRTPRAEIERAKRYRDDYVNREEDE